MKILNAREIDVNFDTDTLNIKQAHEFITGNYTHVCIIYKEYKVVYNTKVYKNSLTVYLTNETLGC